MTSVAAHLPAARCHSANVAALLQFSAVLPVLFFVTLYLQEVQRYSLQEVQWYSALRAGLAFLPLAAGVIVIAPSASWLVGRFGPAPTLIAGPLVFAGGLVYLSYLPVHAPTSLTSCLAWSWSRP